MRHAFGIINEILSQPCPNLGRHQALDALVFQGSPETERQAAEVKPLQRFFPMVRAESPQTRKAGHISARDPHEGENFVC
jgi:hypothetical protein